MKIDYAQQNRISQFTSGQSINLNLIFTSKFNFSAIKPSIRQLGNKTPSKC